MDFETTHLEYRSDWKPSNAKECYVSACLEKIKTGFYKERIQAARSIPDKEKRSKAKVALPSFFPGTQFRSGIPEGKYSNAIKENFMHNVGITTLDFDDLSPENMVKLKEYFKNFQHTLYYFVSPSGNGLKVGIHHPGSSNIHAYKALRIRVFFSLEDWIKALADKSTFQNPSQKVFYSYDADIYVNLEAPMIEPVEMNSLDPEVVEKYMPTKDRHFGNGISVGDAKSARSLVRNSVYDSLATPEMLDRLLEHLCMEQEVVLETYDDYFLFTNIMVAHDRFDLFEYVMDNFDKSRYLSQNLGKFTRQAYIAKWNYQVDDRANKLAAGFSADDMRSYRSLGLLTETIKEPLDISVRVLGIKMKGD